MTLQTQRQWMRPWPRLSQAPVRADVAAALAIRMDAPRDLAALARVASAAAWPEALAGYGTLPAALVAQREADRAMAGPRLVRPCRQVRRRQALAPAGPPPTGRAAATPPGGAACGAATSSARAVTTARHAPLVVTAPRRSEKVHYNKGIDV